MIHRCNVPMAVEGGYRICDKPATHFDSRALPGRRVYCEDHRASDDPPIALIDVLNPGWKGAKDV